MASVLQDWVMGISLRQQGVIILALRGPDGVRKEDVAKPIVRTIRALVMNSGREGHPMARGLRFEGDSFMRMDLIEEDDRWQLVCRDFFASIDQYNIHFIQHLLHAAAVIGFNHPAVDIAKRMHYFYEKGVKALHMKPETRAELTFRLRDGIRNEEDQ